MKMLKKQILSITILAALLGTGVHGADTNMSNAPELKVLVAAVSFDDDVAGERPGNGQSPAYIAYQKLVLDQKIVSPATLKSLQDKATPAGKLYIASLIWEHDSQAGADAYRKLLGDQTKVNYMSGCMGQQYSVGEIARQLLEQGEFFNFRLSNRRKK